MIGVIDDEPEEPRRQDTVESLYTGILLDASEAEEGHAGQLERADLHVLRWQRRKDPLLSIRTAPP